MKVAFTSDIHADVSPENAKVPEMHMPVLLEESPDIFIICGDVSTDQGVFTRTLLKYNNLKCLKLLVAGNHDLWVDNKRENSIEKYRYTLPRLADESGFVYLGFEPSVCGDLAFIGSCGWYDYSFRNQSLDKEIPLRAYKAKEFGGRKWMDAVYCDWSSMEDADIVNMMNQALKRQLISVEDQVSKIVVVLHHVPFREMLVYKNIPEWDFLNAFTGNTSTSGIISSSPKVKVVLYGHTHERKQKTVRDILAVTHSVGYEWEWSARGLDPESSLHFFEI